jgi:putative zinc finger protein
MLSCQEASRLLSDRLDRRLGLGERFGLGMHLAMCRDCSRTAGQLRFLHEAMSQLATRRGRMPRSRK